MHSIQAFFHQNWRQKWDDDDAEWILQTEIGLTSYAISCIFSVVEYSSLTQWIDYVVVKIVVEIG